MKMDGSWTEGHALSRARRNRGQQTRPSSENSAKTIEMLPLYLLNAVKGETVVVELKMGGIVNGTLENCDNYMNVTLTQACGYMSEDEPMHKIDRIYIKGTVIKMFKMGNEFIEQFKAQQQREKDQGRHGNFNNNDGGRYRRNNNNQGGNGRRNNNRYNRNDRNDRNDRNRTPMEA